MWSCPFPRGTQIQLTQPRLLHDEARREIRTVERAALGFLRVYEFLELQVVPDA